MTRAMAPSSTRQAPGRANSGRSSRAPKPSAANQTRCADRRAEAEPPAAVAVGGGDGAEQHDGVEVDVRVEPGQREAVERPAQAAAGLAASASSTAGRSARRAASAPYASRKAAPPSRTTSSERRPAVEHARPRRHAGARSAARRRWRTPRPRRHVLAAQALAQHERVLRADGDDQREPEAEAGEQRRAGPRADRREPTQ